MNHMYYITCHRTPVAPYGHLLCWIMRAACLLRDRTHDCIDPSSWKESAPEAGSSRVCASAYGTVTERCQVPAEQDPGFSLPCGAKGRPSGGESQELLLPSLQEGASCRRPPLAETPEQRGEKQSFRCKGPQRTGSRGWRLRAWKLGLAAGGWGAAAPGAGGEALACGSEVGSEGGNEENGQLYVLSRVFGDS